MTQPQSHSLTDDDPMPAPVAPYAGGPIFLTGFMGCGKSTAGQALADLLGLPFIDLDIRIEAIANCAIADLIQLEGEERFRAIETEVLREAAGIGNAIIASGGGVVTRPENRELMRAAGITVWLDTDFDLCWERIRQEEGTRPLAPDEATARARFEQRRPLYGEAALRIDVDAAQAPEEIAGEILRRIGAEP
ncbi:MAG: shikimate kinase [Blastocatellia bacterium]